MLHVIDTPLIRDVVGSIARYLFEPEAVVQEDGNIDLLVATNNGKHCVLGVNTGGSYEQKLNDVFDYIPPTGAMTISWKFPK